MARIVGTFSGNGSMSDFYKIDKLRGFKTFQSKHDAEYARDIQIELSRLECAPYVLSEIGRIRISGYQGLSAWGYITEIAKTIKNGDNFGEVPRRYRKELMELHKNIRYYTPYEFADDHVGNVGFVIRNKKRVLVCIDTGPESIGSGTSYCPTSTSYNC